MNQLLRRLVAIFVLMQKYHRYCTILLDCVYSPGYFPRNHMQYMFLLLSRSPTAEADKGTTFQVNFLSSDPDFVHSRMFCGDVHKGQDFSLHIQVALAEDYPASAPKFQVGDCVIEFRIGAMEHLT